ncbi:MAG: NUDIX hydrolase [Hyphomicrobiaceae bacterium]
MSTIVTVGRHKSIELVLRRCPWTYAHLRRADIDRHWLLAKAQNPAYFNGAVHMLTSGRDSPGRFLGELLATDFKSFLHWRALGHPDRSVRAVGVGAILWSADGAILLGTAAPGTVNAGRTYLFSGVLDDRDIDGSGEVDVLAGAVREVVEETGLLPTELARTSPWHWSIEDGVWINFVVELTSYMPATDLAERILAHARSQADPELSDVVIIRGTGDLVRPDIFDNTRMLLDRLLAHRAEAAWKSG